MGVSGWEVVAGLVAVAGLLFTIAGFIWGHGKGAGKNSERWNQTTEMLQEFHSEFQKLQTSLKDCQTASATNRASSQERLQTNKDDVQQLRGVLNEMHHAQHMHEANQDIHTNGEWRQTTISRMEKIYSNIDKRLLSFENNFGGRLTSLENTFNNFFNAGTGKGKHEA